MSFPLRRLPFLAIKEVIKSMNTREIFYLSLASENSQNLVMVSVPKNSLSTFLILKADGLLFELKPVDFDEPPMRVFRADGSVTIQESTSLIKVSPSNLHVRCNFVPSSGSSGVEESMRDPFYRFLKTFKKSKIYIRFEEETREEFAMEILRFAWENGFPLDNIDFRLKNASPECIQELLNRCNEQHMSLCIGTKLPEEFKCIPPPGGYKFESLSVNYADWVNLEDFLQCREVHFTREFPDLTPEYLNGVLKKIGNLEYRIDTFGFKLKSIKPTDFPVIVRGLSESEIKQEGERQELQFERKDGQSLKISLFNGYLDLRDVDDFR